MQEQLGATLTPDAELSSTPTPPNSPAPRLPSDLTTYRWRTIALSIALSGGAYAMFLAVVQYTLSMTFFALSNQLGSLSAGLAEKAVMFLMILLGTVLQLVFFAVAGIVLASIVSLFTLPIVYLVVLSLKIRGSVIWLGAFCGGLVGFLSALPFIGGIAFSASQGATDVFWFVVIGLLVGPCLTTVFGQIGGARGGLRAAQQAYPEAFAAAPAQLSAAGVSHAPGDGTPQPRLQFRIHHLLWISLWLSVLLTLIRLCGVPFEIMLPILVGWTVYQAVTLWLGGKIVRRFRMWQLRRTRST
jgi:hypothetical protein